jgi:hypothetical protein
VHRQPDYYYYSLGDEIRDIGDIGLGKGLGKGYIGYVYVTLTTKEI